MINNMYFFMSSTLCSFEILTKLYFLGRFLEKYTNIKFYKIPSNGNGVVLCGRADVTKLLVAIRNFVSAPKY